MLLRRFIFYYIQRPSLFGFFASILFFSWGMHVHAATWTLASAFPSNAVGTGIAASADGTRLAVVDGDGYIYISSNSGATWSSSTSPGPFTWGGITSSADGMKIYASTGALDGSGHMYVFSSTNGGTTWATTSTSQSGGHGWIQITASDDGTKLAAGQLGLPVYVSNDSGATWSTSTSGALRTTKIDSSSDGSKIVVLTDTFIHVSTDGGSTWSTSTSAGSGNWEGVTVSADGSKIAAIQYPGDVHTSTDGGSTWSTSTSAGSGWWGDITSSDDGTKIIAADYNFSNGYIYVSNDNGTTWTQQASARGWLAITASSDGTKVTAIASGVGVYTTALNFTPAVISSISASPTLNGSTITWSTDLAADSQVRYGSSVSYAASSSLNSSLVTSRSVILSGLACNTVYHYRVDSRTTDGVLATSSDQTFTTGVCAPTVTTQAASSVAKTSAVLNGTITADGVASTTVRGFAYGTTIAYGATTTESGTFSLGAFSAAVSSFTCNTSYHVAAYATNASGTSYGSDISFTTSACASSGGGGGGSSGGSSGGGSSTHTPVTQSTSTAPVVPYTFPAYTPVTTTPVTPSSVTIPTRDLYMGISGTDVSMLQQILIQQNKGPLAQHLAAFGTSVYFGNRTFDALKEYQIAVGITPATGTFGPKTREYLRTHLTSAATTPSTVTTTPATAPTIAQLQAQLAQLIALLNALKGTTTQIPTSPTTPPLPHIDTLTPALTTITPPVVTATPTTLPSRTLHMEMEGPDVAALQQILIRENKGPKAQHLAAFGASTFYGNRTYDAVLEYQKAVGIIGTGLFDEQTRTYMKGHGVSGVWW